MTLLSMTQDNEDIDFEKSLRPLYLREFIGQQELRENLKIFIEACKKREDALDHVLLYGPPGLGKTTLAQIISRELGVNFKPTSGPILSRAGDLAALLTNLQKNDILFIDEIHRIPVAVEEVLYTAMEDFKLDIMIGEGPGARSVRIDLQPFTLIGATTRTGLMTQPLLERFGIPMALQFYDYKELIQIIERTASILGCPIEKAAALEIAKRSRGTPRLTGRLLRRVRDFTSVEGKSDISEMDAIKSLDRLKVDSMGLDNRDRKYLDYLAEFYKGGPAGIETLAAALSEHKDTLEDLVEPYLMQQGLLQRTSRGRMLTDRAFEYLGKEPFIKKENFLF
jgi:Holliday junction DNA helicase RuvB